jgi:hypothetical protein
MAAMSDEAMPADPLTGPRQSWVAVHQMYKDMRGGGFSLAEACILLPAWLIISARVGSQDDDSDT